MIKYWFAILSLFLTLNVAAQGNLEINTPAVTALKSAMQGRFAQLEPHFNSGAIGLSGDGLVQLRDASLVPLAQRGAINALLASENADRRNLYKEIARANNHPEWEGDIARTFAQRWADKVRPGWWVQDARGAWVKK